MGSFAACSLQVQSINFVAIHMMASPKDHGVGKNKRKWKEEDDDGLVEVLKDLVNGGIAFKDDKGLKLRGIYNFVHGMVVGGCASRFGCDLNTKSIVAKKEVWKAYAKDLSIIFGKDHVSGKDAQGPKEMEDDVNPEEENEESSKKDEPKSSSTQEPFGVETSSGKSRNLGKWIKAYDGLVKGRSEIAYILWREI
ncbi:hypothetical protein Cgig2_010929 [Carnegiea gigantea]|uniref:Myb/SANT-like domain-containing protein n=1 Tax=Carnegiea gigantea TaxID=171969 RepID=A0A9Q1K2D7_9CARY|nr:hypothetical protein Cgig2_010929 [Carnegiea gigantea]